MRLEKEIHVVIVHKEGSRFTTMSCHMPDDKSRLNDLNDHEK